MAVNRDKPDLWKADIASSVDLYNEWFVRFAPKAFRDSRKQTARFVEDMLDATANLTDITPEVLKKKPSVLPSLRMSTCPPLARDRLVGLAGVPKSMVERMEKDGKLPTRMPAKKADEELEKIGTLIEKLADRDIFIWLENKANPAKLEVERAATIVADRLCGATADPIIRNAQEARQLNLIRKWLTGRGYKELRAGSGTKFDKMNPGTFSFRLNVPAKNNEGKTINIPVDAVIKPQKAKEPDMPLLVEAKSAGDFTNVNKRRKEEATKFTQLKSTYGKGVRYVLFLCGYFDTGYLGYEAAEGIDWVWEHRIEDLAKLAL